MIWGVLVNNITEIIWSCSWKSVWPVEPRFLEPKLTLPIERDQTGAEIPLVHTGVSGSIG